VPSAYELALRAPGWHQLEHACFVGTSLLFWWPVIQPWPSVPQWPRWSIPAYLLCGGIVSGTLAALLCFSDRPFYPSYAAVPRLFELSVLEDQASAGAVMWVFGSFVLLVAAVVVTVRLLDSSAGVSKAAKPLMFPPSRSPSQFAFDLLRTPLVGSLLRARYGRRGLQAILLSLPAAVIVSSATGWPR